MAKERAKVLLTKLEFEVMRAMWTATASPAELTVREVVARLNAGRRKPLAYNTVQTVLVILREKGVVRARSGEGRAHVYVPRVTREQVTTSMVGELVERLFDGRVHPLLLNLVEHEALSRAELEKLRTLIDERLDDAEPPTAPRHDESESEGGR
jgi:predicted transcriptional regulator